MSLADTKRSYFTNGLQSAGVTVDPRWTNTDLEYQFYKTFSGVATGSVSDLRRAFLLKANKISSAPKSNEDLENDLFGTTPNAQFNSTVRVNLCGNPSIEGTVSQWNPVRSTHVQDTTVGFVGTSSLKTTVTDTTGAGLAWRETHRIPVMPPVGAPLSIKMTMWSDVASGIVDYGCGIQFWDATPAAISTPQSGTFTAALPTDFMTVKLENIIIPANSVNADLWFGVMLNANETLNDNVWLDGCIAEATPTVGTYFDGNSAGCYWEGTAHASRSIKIV